MLEKNQALYEPRDVVKMTNIESETLRKYVDFFNIETNWTQPNKKGHRRYTKDNVNQLISIKERVANGWSWKQIRGLFNGDEEFFVNREEKSRLEDKLDLLIERQKTQDEFNQVLVQKLDEISSENSALKLELKSRDAERDQEVVEAINQLLLSQNKQIEKQEKNQENKSWFSKIFGR